MSFTNPEKVIQYIMLGTYISVLAIMFIVYTVATNYNIPFEKITGDPASTFKANPLTGIISNIGVLLWCASATVCFFTAFTIKSTQYPKEIFFLICSGFLTLILLFDDFFMIHDYLLYSIGLNQYVMYAFYILIFTLYLIHFRIKLLETKNLLLLVSAFIFFGSSVTLDVFTVNEGLEYFIEDSLKFFGITSWFLFFSTFSFYTLKKNS